MQLGAYIHQFDQMSEQTVTEIAASLKRGGISEVRFKTHQWTTWTGHFDDGGAADLIDLDAVKATAAAFQAAGIRVVPWCVPMGLDVEAEAQRAAEVARVCGAIDFDVEPYKEFWPWLAVGDYSAVVPFFSRVRELLGAGVEITLDFPARDSSWEWGRVKTAVQLAAPYVDRLALQSYFGTAQARDAEARTRAIVTDKPIDHISDVPHLAEMLGQHKDAERLLIWRAADLDASAYRVLEEWKPPTSQPRVPKLVQPIREQNQFDCANYDTYTECQRMQGAACSAATLAAALTGYGIKANVSEGLRRIRATGDDVTPEYGLMNTNGQAMALVTALGNAGIPATRYQWDQFTRFTFMEVLDSERPILCQVQKYLGRFGHYLVVTGVLPDRSGVTVADSNAGNGKRTSYSWNGLWADMAGGVAIWADTVEGDVPDEVAQLKEQLKALNGKVDGLTQALAVLGDDQSERLNGIAKQLQDVAKESQRIRVQFLGPKIVA